MYHLAKLYSARPSSWLEMAGPVFPPTPEGAYWRWAFDDACGRAAAYDMERRKRLEEQNPFAKMVTEAKR